MSLPAIFDACRPRADVLAGTIRDDEFMADLSRVVNGTAPADYLDPAAFFSKSSHPWHEGVAEGRLPAPFRQGR